MIDEQVRGIGDNGGPPLIIEFTKPQHELITSNARYPAMVAGFGAGKTQALCYRAVKLKLDYPTNDIAYYLPTYDLVNRIAIPRFIEVLAEHGLYEKIDYKVINGNSAIIHVFDGGDIIFRTMDRPGRIIGYEVADSFVDELDTLKEVDARLVWQKIISRNRQKKPDGADNTIAVGTTPEGFKFVYDRWKRNPPSEQYVVIKASTYSNARNLPSEYIPDLIAEYPPNLIQAYLDGEFVNLTSGSVYPEFSRKLNHCDSVVLPGEALHLGMDFNVGKMAAVVFVNRGGWPHAVDELVGLRDTPDMIDAIKRRFPNHTIFVYPDATGGNRETLNASASDLSLLEEAGFHVLAEDANPLVKDRIISVNRLIFAGGKRRLLVNTNLCPAFTEGLEKQAYDEKGKPDKTAGFDHVIDAGGYFIYYRYPVVNSRVVKVKIGGV